MLKGRAKNAAVTVVNRSRKLASRLGPYRPMEQGKDLLDAQYSAAEWDYLHSLGEAPRLGVVSVYCQMLATDGALLEIGCGDGILLRKLDRNRFQQFTGVDLSSVAIERARGLEDDRTTFVCAAAETFVPDRTYDAIVFNEVLEYFDDPLAVVRRYEPHLRADGAFVVSMFAGVSTDRTRRIWKMLDGRYRTVTHAKVSNGEGYLWNIKVLKPAAS